MTWRRRYLLWIALALLPVAALVAYLLYPKRAPRLTLEAVGYDQLAGWRDDGVAAVLPALLRSCTALLGKTDDAKPDSLTKSFDFGTIVDWRAPCAGAAALPAADDNAARQFFEVNFAPFLAGNNGDSDGLFTGYFEITLEGARQRGGSYQTPLFRRPPDSERTQYSRAAIENGALAGKGLELLWVSDPVDAFFLEIQGSGLVRLHEGGSVRVGYDGSNGKPYVAVGRILIDRGDLPREQVTMAGIRAWMKKYPKEGADLRRENPSYVFFHELTGPGPLGAERVVLTADRSLAVDRRFIPLGVPIWLDAKERYSESMIRRLVIAQDAGGAIKGPVRGDLFWGHGKKAADGAGAMNAKGRDYLLLPKTVAVRITAANAAH